MRKGVRREKERERDRARVGGAGLDGGRDVPNYWIGTMWTPRGKPRQGDAWVKDWRRRLAREKAPHRERWGRRREREKERGREGLQGFLLKVKRFSLEMHKKTGATKGQIVIVAAYTRSRRGQDRVVAHLLLLPHTQLANVPQCTSFVLNDVETQLLNGVLLRGSRLTPADMQPPACV